MNKKIGVLTDSHSGISQEQAKQLGITVLPMPFVIDGETYLEGITLTREDFFQKLTRAQEVSTTQPTPAFVMESWDKALKEYEQIIYIPISSGLSGGCSTAATLAQSEEYEGKVFVVDNGRVATPLHRSILDALELIEQGHTAEEIQQILERSKEKMTIYIGVDSLKYLHRGGRVSGASAVLGTMMNIKPILKFGTGLLSQYKKCRGVHQMKKELLAAMKYDLENTFREEYERGEVHLLAASSASKEQTQDWVEEIQEAFPDMEVLCDDLALAVSCHIGPGGLGIGCSCKPCPER